MSATSELRGEVEGLQKRVEVTGSAQVAQPAQPRLVARRWRRLEARPRVSRELRAGRIVRFLSEETLEHYLS